MSELNTCPFCKSKQLEVVQIDMKDPDRDLIKCRHCKGQVMRYHWNERHITLEQAKKVIKANDLSVIPNYMPAKMLMKYVADGYQRQEVIKLFNMISAYAQEEDGER